MRSVYLISLAVLATASPLGIGPTIERRGSLPTPVSVATAKEYLSELKVAEPVLDPPYKRSGFKHWITIEGRCDTRETVLKRDATIEVTVDSECKPTAGLWTSDYDGRSFTSATSLDIDHIVPLKEGWQAGAYNWTAKRREEFANDLIRPQLVAVSASSNRMKADKDPSRWMPSNEAYHCTYIRAWIQVKHYYELTIDSSEKEALERYIDQC